MAPRRSLKWRSAWIIGASTGIGRALALELAGRGVNTALSARSADKLDELAAQSSNLVPIPLDASDFVAVDRAHSDIQNRFGTLDLVFFCAATYRSSDVSGLTRSEIRETINLNYTSVVESVTVVLPSMKAQGYGHIVIMASVAGYQGLPNASLYGSTKAALINFAEAIKPELEAHGLKVSLVNPGFVKTPLTDKNDFPMPFMIEPEEAATRIVKGLETGKFEIAFPRRFVLQLKLMKLLPYSVFFALIRKVVLKK